MDGMLPFPYKSMMAHPPPARSAFHACFLLLAASLACGALESAGGVETPGLRPGSVIELQGRTARLIKLDSLPLVESNWSKRFHFDKASNPKLKELRERYHLDEVTASGQDEFDRQVRLMDWTHRQFKKFGRPSSPAKGALEILPAIGQDHRFFCAQYAEVLVSTAASLGWINRPLALRRHQGVNKVGGSTEHSVTEIWSNPFRKWIMLDPTSNLFIEKAGVPLNAFEIRQEWFLQGGRDLVFVVGKERQKYRKADLPILLGHFEEFGDLTVEPDEPDKYGFIGFIPNTNLMDAGFDYGGMFIIKDALCDGTRWHLRDNPPHPATDPYFPLGQSTLTLAAEGSAVRVTLQTMTPNFERFEIRSGEGGWKPAADNFLWKIQPGLNRLEARTVNAFGVTGPVSTAELGMDP